LAVSHAGAVLLPINYRLGADEVRYIAGHAGAKLLFVDEELPPRPRAWAVASCSTQRRRPTAAALRGLAPPMRGAAGRRPATCSG
jgi:fatty-acyl-CoA synthase